MEKRGIWKIAAALLVVTTQLSITSTSWADDADKAKRASGDMNVLRVGLEAYHKHFDHLPNETEGLWALMIPEKSADATREWPGFLRKMMFDPWGNEYFFERTGDRSYKLRSYGPDKIRSADDVVEEFRIKP